MIEIEVKARADHQKIKKLLEGMGAQAIGIEKHHDTYYNAPHRDFAITDEALRIRLRNGEAILTYKGKKLDRVSKTRNEFETPVDGENTRSILLELGFVETTVVKKTREVFEFDDLTICLDSLDGLGEFIEVEIVADSDVDYHRARLFGFLKKLGIREEESIRRSYMELLM